MIRFDIVVAAVAIALCAGNASALSQRTFVSKNGSNLNPCTIALPCRAIATAISHTLPGGEVVVLDSAGYGTFSVTSSISIVAPPGVVASISSTLPSAIVVNAGASDTVVLRGLTLIGHGLGDNGILVLKAGIVQIEDCDVGSFTTAGVSFLPSVPISLAISGTVLHDNQFGLRAVPSNAAGAASRVEIWRTRAQDNSGDGFRFSDITRTVIVDSHAAGSTIGIHFIATSLSATDTSAAIERTSIVNNGAFGVLALGTSSGPFALVNIANSIVSNNEAGLGASDASEILLTASQLTGNNTGIIEVGSGLSFTLSTNMRYGNNSAGSTPTALPPNLP